MSDVDIVAITATDMFFIANGAVIDYTPLTNLQLTNMIKELPATIDSEKEHLTEVFATVNGFSVKDSHQIFHPSTQLRPAIDPAQTHWREEASINPSRETNAFDDRYVQGLQKSCQTGIERWKAGCRICIIYDAMSARFCHSGDF